MTRADLLREAAMLRACTCGLPDHKWIAAELEQKAALLPLTPEGGGGAAPGTQDPASTPTSGLCEHGCCLTAVCDWCGDCSSHGGAA